MKLSPKAWCKIQEMIVNNKCPHCFSSKVILTEEDKKNAKCKDCGCEWTFSPDIEKSWVD